MDQNEMELLRDQAIEKKLKKQLWAINKWVNCKAKGQGNPSHKREKTLAATENLERKWKREKKVC
jgi:hypothetical protein